MIQRLLKFTFVISFFLLLFSCKDKQEDYVIEPMEPRKPIVDFGFNFDDFNVQFDTIRSQDTFERILKKQNLGNHKAAEIIAKIKDSMPTSVRFMRPYICLRSKDKFHKLQYLIYQPNRIDYYLVDLTDSIVGHKKSRPLTFKTKTIAGALDGSLSSTLRGMKVQDLLSYLVK